MSFINLLRRVDGALPLFLLEFFRAFSKNFLPAGRYGICVPAFSAFSVSLPGAAVA